MFGIDAPELMVIAVVALIFIGPKELPGMLRSIGKWMATARNMAGEFRGHVDDMMRQADLDDLKKQVEAGAKDAVLDLQGLDPTREIKSVIDEGARDAEKELADARASIEAATADAEIAPAVTTAELTAPAEPVMTSLAGDAAPAEPEFAAVPPAGEIPVPPAPDGLPSPPAPAATHVPAVPPQKVAVG
jgi:sec-independent protein translocase protein TatB